MNNLASGTPTGTPTGTQLRLKGIGVLIALILIIVATLYQAQPPSPKPTTAPETEFSAERAIKHVNVIAQKPHPTGSAENVKVREYLMKELESVGLTPEVQTGVGSYGSKTFLSTATVNNVVARLKGTDNTKAVLLMSHYDSGPVGPGANDDGTGVAAELETLRALKAGEPLKNDVIFLFTDGEELGLLGADVFWREHPWVKDVGVVLNFEARGGEGASLMFQTSEQNGWLIQQFAQVANSPVTNSLLGDLYRTLPNNTDMTISNQAGVSGLNFAYGDNWPVYHTERDSLETVDLGSLQHHGENALQLTKQFGNQDMTNTKAPDRVYFNLFGQVVHYPKTWVMPLSLLVTLLFVTLLTFGVRKKELSLKKIGLGLLAVLVSLLVPAVSFGLWFAADMLWAGEMQAMTGDTYYSQYYEMGFVTLTFAIISLLIVLFSKRIGKLNLFSSVLLFWVILMWASTVLLSGASYIFTWPLLISLLVFGFALRSGTPETTLERPLPLLITALPVVFLITSILSLLFIFMPVQINAVAMLLVVLSLMMLLPHVNVMMEDLKRWLPVLSISTTAVLLIVTAVTAENDKEHPLPNNIMYYLNADTGEANWVSMSKHEDSWTAQFLEGHSHQRPINEVMPISVKSSVLTSPVPSIPLNAPELSVLSDQKNGEGRDVQIRITSKRQSSVINLMIVDPNVTEITINGTTMARKITTEPWMIEHYATPETERIINFKSKSPEKFAVSIFDVVKEMPELPGKTFTPRPDTMIPAPKFDSSTIVSKTYTL